MKKFPTLFLIAFVLLTGLVLIPFVGVHGQTFRWQNYAGVYEDAVLLIDHVIGVPGSYFHVNGSGFSPNVNVAVSVNGIPLGNVQTNADGELEFNLNTDSAELGRYGVLAEEGGDSARTVFFLVRFGSMHPLTGDGTVFDVPANSGEQVIYLPFTSRK
jgi:hypothetical protein